MEKSCDRSQNMSGQIFVHAANIHQGGGANLLLALLQAIKKKLSLSVDSRMPIPDGLLKDVQTKLVEPTVWSRLLSEKWLYQNVSKDDIVILFGNLPPIFRLRGHTVVFLQNRYLVDNISLKGFPIKSRFRLIIERWWVRIKLKNVDQFIVQTPTMKSLLEAKLKRVTPIQILPFVAKPEGYTRMLVGRTAIRVSTFDFVYVASGEPHKNHRQLIKAWCLLAREGLFPSLCLTLDEHRFSELCFFIEEMRRQHSLNIVNVGVLAHNEILAVYEKSAAAIYPSLFESFGLPLIEARQAGLPILASELDFVRDVLDPEQVFDPNSPTSIARAVKRFKGEDEPSLPLLDATQFLASILKKDV